MPLIRPADEFEDDSDEFSAAEAPRTSRLRRVSRGLGAKAGAMMAVAMFALGFVAVKGHVGKHPDAAPAEVALAATPSPVLAPSPAPAAPAVVADTTSPAPPSKHVDANAATRVDPTATGSIAPEAKHKHKHKHKLDAPKPAQPD